MVETRKARPFSVYCCEILVVAPGRFEFQSMGALPGQEAQSPSSAGSTFERKMRAEEIDSGS